MFLCPQDLERSWIHWADGGETITVQVQVSLRTQAIPWPKLIASPSSPSGLTSLPSQLFMHHTGKDFTDITTSGIPKQCSKGASDCSPTQQASVDLEKAQGRNDFLLLLQWPLQRCQHGGSRMQDR